MRTVCLFLRPKRSIQVRNINLGFWSDKRNQKIFFDRLHKQFQIKNHEEWYQLKSADIKRYGGISVLHYHGDSLYKALSSLYPNHSWRAWKFIHSNVPDGFWKDFQNQKSFCDDLMIKLGISLPQEWKKIYSIKQSDIKDHGGSGLLSVYSNSPTKLLTAVYNEHPWEIFRFVSVPNSYWKSIENIRNFFGSLGKSLNISSQNWEEWYKIKYGTILDYGGASLLSIEAVNRRKSLDVTHEDVEESPISTEALKKRKNIMDFRKLLMTAYPEYPWNILKFEKLPMKYWNDIEAVREAVGIIEKEIGISNPIDWYQVTYAQMLSLGTTSFGLLKFYGNLYNLLSAVYPDYGWDIHKFYNSQLSSKNLKVQQSLFRHMKDIFPTQDIYLNYPHPVLST